MTVLGYMAEHTAFIKWFGSNYPQLNKMYGVDITAAIDETGFIINWKNMDKEMSAVIRQITNDYYYLMSL